MEIKVGVVGVGHLGMHHARIYSEMPGVKLVGVVDNDKDRVEMIANTLNVPYFTDLESFIAATSPDAINIVVPTKNHYEVAVKAMNHGIHILVEKPVTTTLQEAEELLRLVKEKKLILQVGHIERFNSAITHLTNFLEEPYFIRSQRIGPFSARIADVGVVLDLMIHDVDIILSIIKSKVKSISAVGRSIISNHEDIASLQLLFENGAIAEILVSRVSEKRCRQMEIMDKSSFVTVNYETQDIIIQNCKKDSAGSMLEISEHPLFLKTEPLKLELQHFISSIRNGSQPLVGIEDGKRALEICIDALHQINP
ncbi:MAG: Gfo/Idh/MocA family oxidoreductase [Synergistaceae bacterium]